MHIIVHFQNVRQNCSENYFTKFMLSNISTAMYRQLSMESYFKLGKKGYFENISIGNIISSCQL